MVILGDFKGNPIITIKKNEADRFGITFGISKAELLLDHMEEIRQFVKDNKAKIGGKS